MAKVTVLPEESTSRMIRARMADCSIEVPTQEPETRLTNSELLMRRPTFWKVSTLPPFDPLSLPV